MGPLQKATGVRHSVGGADLFLGDVQVPLGSVGLGEIKQRFFGVGGPGTSPHCQDAPQVRGQHPWGALASTNPSRML